MKLGKMGITFRTFCKPDGRRTGQTTILHTSSVTGVCSAFRENGLNLSYFASKREKVQAKLNTSTVTGVCRETGENGLYILLVGGREDRPIKCLVVPFANKREEGQANQPY